MKPKTAAAAISIAIVEDDRETREGLVEFLTGETRVHCVGAYPTGEAAVSDIPRLEPQVALVDINLPGMSGIECVSQLKKATAPIAGVNADQI